MPADCLSMFVLKAERGGVRRSRKGNTGRKSGLQREECPRSEVKEDFEWGRFDFCSLYSMCPFAFGRWAVAAVAVCLEA